MQIIIDLRLNLVRDLLNDQALEGDAEQRLTALLVHRYEEESPALTPIPRPLREVVRELLHAHCIVAMRKFTSAFTFDQLRECIKALAGSTDAKNTFLFDGISAKLLQTMYCGQHLPILRNTFAEYVITENPTINGPGVTYHLLPLEGSVGAYVVRCRESTDTSK